MAMLVSALVFLGAVFATKALLRETSAAAHAAAAVLVAGTILVTAALVPARVFSRRALLGAGLLLALGNALPLLFVADPAGWLRKNPMLLSYAWLWLVLLGLPAAGARRWCTSGRVLLLVSALLSGGLVMSALW